MRISLRAGWSAALLAAALALAARASADAAPGSVEACIESAAKQPATVFSVVVDSYPTVVERRLDIAGINRVRPGRAPQAILAHGLCVADYRLRYATKTRATCWSPGGHTCAWLGSVTIDLTPDDIRIYIPKEYRAGSCEATQLMNHEREHEQLHRKRLDQLAQEMREALARSKDLPGPLTPINADAPEKAYARLKTLVDAVVRPIYENYLKEIEKEQDGLDDPQSYRELGARCSGWKR